MERKHRDEAYARYVVYIGMILGICLATGLTIKAYYESNRAAYFLVLHDDFQSFSQSNWQHEQQLGGYVEGSLDWTCDSIENSWVEDGMLKILPTIETPHSDGDFVDLSATGVCTSTLRQDCYVLQNSTGYTAVPNIKTARLKTRKSFTFGKAEIVAKMPKGDWIFSTIGLDPEGLIYGQFPASGKIEVAQSRGNERTYPGGGLNSIDSIVHFGSDGQAYADAAQLARSKVALSRTDFSAKFHTYGIEWTPTKIRTWLDYSSNTILTVTWPKGFWRKADYGRYQNDINYAYLTDPWTNGSLSAPYDVPFHLTLRSNVGSVSGIFGDSPNKPWSDDAGRGASILTLQRNESWSQSWGTAEERTMYVKDVKIWQQIDPILPTF